MTLQQQREKLIKEEYMPKRKIGASADEMVKFFAYNATVIDKDGNQFMGKEKIAEYFSKSQEPPSFIGEPVSVDGTVIVRLEFKKFLMTWPFNVTFHFINDSTLIEKLTVSSAK